MHAKMNTRKMKVSIIFLNLLNFTSAFTGCELCVCEGSIVSCVGPAIEAVPTFITGIWIYEMNFISTRITSLPSANDFPNLELLVLRDCLNMSCETIQQYIAENEMIRVEFNTCFENTSPVYTVSAYSTEVNAWVTTAHEFSGEVERVSRESLNVTVVGVAVGATATVLLLLLTLSIYTYVKCKHRRSVTPVFEYNDDDYSYSNDFYMESMP